MREPMMSVKNRTEYTVTPGVQPRFAPFVRREMKVCESMGKPHSFVRDCGSTERCCPRHRGIGTDVVAMTEEQAKRARMVSAWNELRNFFKQ